MQKRVLYIAFLLLAICNKIVAEDQITISDFNLYPGDTKEVSVVLTNEETYVGFQFDLYLPTGVTVESFSASSRIPEGTTPQMAQQTDGSYRFVAAALGGNPIAGNDGPVLTLTVKAGDSIAANAYTGYLRNVKISKADGSGVVIAEQPFTVTIAERPKVANVVFAQNGYIISLSTTTEGATIRYNLSNGGAGEQTYNSPLTMTGDCTITAYAMKDGFNASDTTAYTFIASDVTVATPTFNQTGNVVTITTTTENATIYYTTDGTTPTTASNAYPAGGITVTSNVTIKAIAVRDNWFNSAVAEYHVNSFKVSNVQFAQSGNMVTLSTTTANAKIFYTLSNDGNGEQEYTAPLTMTGDCTIEAWATRDGYLPSDTTSFVFHAGGVTCSNPVFARNGNVINISTQTDGASIYYTIDGTDPTEQSILYTEAITVDHNMTIKAIAMRQNYYSSQIETFMVDWFKCEMPTIISWSGDTLRAVSATEDAIVNCILRFTSDGPVAQWSGGPDPQLTLPIQNDLYVELFATKEGWMTSDTLKFYYPYTAWHQLTDAINDANTVLAAAANNDNVTDADRNALSSLIEAAQQSYAARTETESAVKARTDELVAQTAIVRQLVEAVNEPYAVLSENNTVLTFYYDKKKDERGGLDIGPFNNGASGRGWHEARNAITTVKFDDSFRNETTLTSTAWWFSELTSLTAIEGLTNLNTSNVTDMWGMFEQCSALTSLDLSNFDTRKVEKMAYMFDGCRNLRSLDVSGFNTESVSEMGAMFQNCSSLPSLNVTNFNTANNRSMWGLFNGLTVSTLDLSSFNTAKVNDMGYVFANCSNLRTIFVGSGWTTQSVAASEQTGSVGGYDMFAGCINLVGGAGTTFDPDHVDELYARIDGGTSAPGYLTDINSGVAIYVQANEIPYLYAFDADGNALNGEFPGKLMTDTATVNGQLFYKTRIYRSVPFNINIIDKDLYRTREIYVISDRYFVYEGQSKYTDVTTQYFNAPEIQISSLALPGSHNNWDKMQQFEVVETGKKYSMQIDLGDMTFEDNQLQFKLYANNCAWLGITSLTLDAPSYVHSIGNPELIASDRNIVINLANAPTREFKFEATWNGGTQMEEGWTLKISEVEVQPEYTFDNGTGVLAVSGGTTLAEALDAAGGRDEVAKTITAIVWNSTATLTNSDLQGLDNPNMLVYVQSASQAPANRDNVVIGNDSTGYIAKNIKLTDVTEGHGDFYCPIAFTAEMISYTHEYRQQTEVGVSRGWETIAMPFTVQTIMHETKGLITPFGTDSINKHFWLRQLTQQGLAQARQIEANTPYLISMPNSDAYSAGFNLNGLVTFSSQNADVPVTQLNVVEAQTATGDMVLLQPNFKGQSATAIIYALNVGVQRDDHPEGSVFEANYRAVRPFEAFTVHHGNGPAPQFISISEMNGDVTGIEDVRCKMSDGRGDNWYDLNGRRLQQKPTKKGIYILNGKKTIIK